MRKLMWFTVGFLIACFVGTFLEWGISWISVFVCAGIGMLLLFVTHWVRKVRIVAAIMLGLAVGLGWWMGYDALYLVDARELDGTSKAVMIAATDYSVQTDYGGKVEGNLMENGKTYRVVLYFDRMENLEPGDMIHTMARFTFTAQGGMQEPAYQRSDGIFLTASQRGTYNVEKPDHVPWYLFGAIWRNRISSGFETLFSGETLGFAKALILGERSDISYEVSTAFKVCGVSHIVAVSGLHVSILFSVIYLLCGRKRVLVFLLGMPVLLAFGAITGFTPSVTRACLMQMLVLLAMLMERDYDMPTALSFAVLVMLVANPMVIVSISFQLSAGCMAGIALFYKPISEYLKARVGSGKGKSLKSRLKRWFVGSVSVCISAMVVTLPIVAYHFETVSLVSVVMNLLIVWLIPYLFCGILFSWGLSFLWLEMGSAVASLVTIPIRIMIGLLKTVARIPFAAVYTENAYIVAWFIGCYLLLIGFLLMKKKRVALTAMLMCIGLCLSLILSWIETNLDDTRVTVMDVGQGQSILLQGSGETFLVDCGGDSDSLSADMVAETLLGHGIFRLDGIIITHYDRDHVGGILNLLTRISADVIYLPVLADETGAGERIKQSASGQCVLVDHDMILTFGSHKLTMFAPEDEKLENECSLCVLFQDEKCDILITGDRGFLGERLLIERFELPELELLIAGHHGSKYATGEVLLGKTKPKNVIISVGENSYGHPAEELLERLYSFGCLVFRTDRYGTIVYRG